MQAMSHEIENLFALQKLSLVLKQVEKKFEEMPQRQQILQLRQKRQEIVKKQEQVRQLLAESEKELTRIGVEDEKAAAKEKEIQKLIEQARGDFREVNARSKELHSVGKTRTYLSEKHDEAADKVVKLQGMNDQIEAALKVLDQKEAEAVESFKTEGTALQRQIAAGKAEIENLRKAIPADVLKAYDSAALLGGGVGVGKLGDDRRCGCCRAEIDSAHLVQLRKQAPIGNCPRCNRLLVL